MEQNKLLFQRQNLSLLFSSMDEIEVHVITGLLETNDIEVIVTTDGVGPVTGEREGIYSKYDIYVSARDIPTARNILIKSEGTAEIHSKDRIKRTPKKHKIILRILLLLTSLFFASLTFFAIVADESVMASVLCVISIFFLVVMYFTFNPSAGCGVRAFGG